MVLSNKKQKQKLRAARAEALAAYPGKSEDFNLGDSNSLGIITGQDSQKGSLSKREKRRQKSQDENLDGSKSNETSDKAEKKERKRDGSTTQQENLDGGKSNEISDATEKTNAYKLNSDGTEVKKRKSDDGKASENVKEKAVPLKKKKKKQKKKKKAKKNVENWIVREGGQQNGSTPNGEYTVATLDEARKRYLSIIREEGLEISQPTVDARTSDANHHESTAQLRDVRVSWKSWLQCSQEQRGVVFGI